MKVTIKVLQELDSEIENGSLSGLFPDGTRHMAEAQAMGLKEAVKFAEGRSSRELRLPTVAASSLKAECEMVSPGCVVQISHVEGISEGQ